MRAVSRPLWRAECICDVINLINLDYKKESEPIQKWLRLRNGHGEFRLELVQIK